MKSTFFIIGIVFSASLLSADTLTNVGYPPPGGVTLGSSGSAGGSGKTYSYSNFDIDPTLYSAFYWGPTTVLNVYNSTDANQNPAPMAFEGLIDGAYEFDSTATWALDSTQYGNQNLNTRVLLTVTGLGAEDTEANLGASSDPSYPLFLVTGAFTATYQIQADENGTWTGVTTLYNELNTPEGNRVETSVGFSFFSDPATAPEPGTWMLLGSGMVIVAVFGRKRRLI